MKIFACDTETTGFNPYKGDYPFLFIWTDGTKEPVATKDKEQAKKFFEDPSTVKVFQNAKYDLKMLRSVGIEVAGPIWDTMVMAHLYDENLKSKSLEALAETFLEERKQTDVVKQWFKDNDIADEDINYEMVPDEIMIPYAKMDVVLTLKLFNIFEPALKEQNLWSLLENEVQLTRVLVDVEWRGVRIDVPYFKKLKPILEKDIEIVEKEVYEVAGKTFNIGSNKQFAPILKSFGIDVKLSAKGKDKLDKDVLKKIDHPIAPLVLKYRGLLKLYTTYCVGLLRAEVDEIIHSDLYQIGARTGRFSSFEPNLQNITKPKKDKQSGEFLGNTALVRKGFIPRVNYTNFYIDYKQMEYRTFADYAEDTFILAEIKRGVDFHEIVANTMGMDRDRAKTLNFGLLYGMGIPALMSLLGLEATEEECQSEQAMREGKGYHNWYLKRFGKEAFEGTNENFVRFGKAKTIKEEYFSKFTTVEPFIKSVKATINRRGYVFNKFKRRRRLTKFESYKGVNALIQGCCADIVKHTMVKVHEFLRPYKSNMILMVHDELVFEIHDDEHHLVPELKKIMEDWSHLFEVKLEVDVEYTGTNWADKVAFEG